jgi:hypothetical protein
VLLCIPRSHELQVEHGRSDSIRNMCHVVLNGETVVEGSYGVVRNNLLPPFIPKMDPHYHGWLLHAVRLERILWRFFVVAESQGFYVKNLVSFRIDHCVMTMPALVDGEAFEIGNILREDKSLIQEN